MKDNDREPVLAHVRFQEVRQDFEGLPLAERFKKIEQTNLWGADSSVSGLGSEAGATQSIISELPRLFGRLGVRSVLDAPCGDAGWIGEVAASVDYIGVDIVPSLIERNSANWSRDGSAKFLVADITKDALPKADLILCRDCLVHLSFANIAAAVLNFQVSGAKWLLATTFPLLQENKDCEDGDWRGLNFNRAPFLWPKPLTVIGESCGEGNGTWGDKSLALWALADLPGTSRCKQSA
jgi:hypothetical protein